MFRALALASAALAVALEAGCGGGPHPSHFYDSFDGSVFPSKGWSFGGPMPVLDSTSGVVAPSMTWIACAGSNGAYAQIDRTFDGAYSLAANTDFAIYGSAASAQTGIAFHIAGDYGDDAIASILPAPTGQISVFIDGIMAPIPAPTDGLFHALGFDVDQSGQSGWYYDGGLVLTAGPVQSITWQAEFLCGEGDATAGLVPILIDEVDIQARPRP